METTTTSETLPEVMTVLGREYRLVSAEESPPRWTWGCHQVTLLGYPGMWRSTASVTMGRAWISLFSEGETPEAALRSLESALDAVPAQHMRAADLVRGALEVAA